MAAPSPRPLPVPAGPDVLDVLPDLEAALTGRAPVLPYAAAGPVPHLAAHDPDALPDGLAVAIGTSGSTGRPKRALLTADALERSAWATHQVLGGSGAWLLAMPAHHIAGLQVLLRCLAAGTPAVLDLRDGFTPAGFARGRDRPERGCPAPLHGARAHPAVPARRRPRRARGPARLRRRARRWRGHPGGPRRALPAGVTVDLTYGLSETAGGCVYDGAPLPVSRVHVDNDRHVVLGGDTMAHGYLGSPPDQRRVHARPRRRAAGSAPTTSATSTTTGASSSTDAPTTSSTPVASRSPRRRRGRDSRHVEACSTSSCRPARPEWGESVCAAVTLVDPTGHLTTREVRERLRGILPERPCPAGCSCSPPSPSAARASPTVPRSDAPCRTLPERWQDGTSGPTRRQGDTVPRVLLVAWSSSLTIYAVVDCVQTERRPGADHAEGGLARPRRPRPRGRAGRLARRRPRTRAGGRAGHPGDPRRPIAGPRGPDDDPDFLRS